LRYGFFPPAAEGLAAFEKFVLNVTSFNREMHSLDESDKNISSHPHQGRLRKLTPTVYHRLARFSQVIVTQM
jgi:hypothetical protein